MGLDRERVQIMDSMKMPHIARHGVL